MLLYKWQGHHIIVHTDSTVKQGIINKGWARNMTCLFILQLLGSLAIDFNFTISAVHIPGKINELADTISGLHEPGRFDNMYAMLQLYHAPCIQFLHHMSFPTWLSLFQTSLSSADS